MAPIRFGMIGGGWRAEFFTRIARELPERFQLVGVVQRDRAKAEAFGAARGAPAYSTYAELAAAGPDFVVLSVKPDAHLPILTELHQLGLAVLCETPAALDVEAMISIWRLVEQGLRLHIAEQYLFQPLHASRLQMIVNGALGNVSFRVSLERQLQAALVSQRTARTPATCAMSVPVTRCQFTPCPCHAEGRRFEPVHPLRRRAVSGK